VSLGTSSGASEYFAMVPLGPVAPLLVSAAWQGRLGLNQWQQEFVRRSFYPPPHPKQTVHVLAKEASISTEYVPKQLLRFHSLLTASRKESQALVERRERAASARRATAELRGRILALEKAEQRASNGEEEEEEEGEGEGASAAPEDKDVDKEPSDDLESKSEQPNDTIRSDSVAADQEQMDGGSDGASAAAAVAVKQQQGAAQDEDEDENADANADADVSAK